MRLTMFGPHLPSALLIACISSLASAADDGKTIYGLVTLGKPLSVPECQIPPGRSYPDVTTLTAPCLEWPPGRKFARIQLPIRTAPAPLKNGDMLAYLDGDIVEAVTLVTPGIQADAILRETLTAKFGQPTRLTTATMRTGNGVEWPVTQAFWQQPDFTVTYTAAEDRIDSGRVYIETPRGQTVRLEREGLARPQPKM